MTVPLNTTQFVRWSEEATSPTVDALTATLVAEGFSPQLLTDSPDEDYGWHHHETAQMLLVVMGSMDVRIRTERFSMQAGDRLYLAPHEEHAATVGPEGVTYFDVARQLRT